MNDIFGDIEKSVNIMSGYILDFLDNAEPVPEANCVKCRLWGFVFGELVGLMQKLTCARITILNEGKVKIV